MTITNLKELYSLDNAEGGDLFNTLCDTLINDIINFKNNSDYISFREHIYDILTYDINVCECIFYVIETLVTSGHLISNKCSKVLPVIHDQLVYYNNNYRPIYHLEVIFYEIITSIHGS
jgi:hypothetical protein